MLIKLLKTILWLLAGLLIVYFATAFVLVMFPANAKVSEVSDTTAHDSLTAYIASNGVHTDIILPIASEVIDWKNIFPPSDFKAVPPDAAYIAIGWGSRDFYLNTPHWKDLTVSHTLNAILGQDPTLLHVTYLNAADLNHHYTYLLDRIQYEALTFYILASIAMRNAHPSVLAHSGYGMTDVFYEARGTYSLIQTCNTWTGTGLRNAGVKMSYWTPFDFLVTWHLTKADKRPPHLDSSDKNDQPFK